MITNYFTSQELACHCCGEIHMNQEFLDLLNAARDIAGIPFRITSGYRCEKHNREVGSTSTNHTSGQAADIDCNDTLKRYIIVSALIVARMPGIGIGKEFIHADNNHTVPNIFVY